MLSSVSQLNLRKVDTRAKSLRRVTASVAFALGIKQDVWFAACNLILRNLLHRCVVEMHPAAFVVGVSRVVAVACAGPLVHDDGGQVVNACRVGSTCFGSAVEHELCEIQRCDRKVYAQVYFSSAKDEEQKWNFFVVKKDEKANFTSCSSPTKSV